MALRDQLHDAIDAQEDLADRAQAVVDALRPKLPDLVDALMRQLDDDEIDARDGADIVQEALEVMAAAAEAKLAGLTTEAVHTGARLAQARARGG